ncbi:MAG: DegT/DnrJ/EryC1/StrS family aminotransferase [Porphyromonadaceae bacterium]|nr:DegT/DnrJ/EryC1/StrS family aminotransferase [Porphyromonadaceae bacterium]
MKIPMADPARQYQFLREELDAAVQHVLGSGQYIGGASVSAFERELAEYLGLSAESVISCANGTDALELAYEAIGLEAGDEVIIPVHNYVAAAEAAVRLDLIPVWADATGEGGVQCYNIDPNALEGLISPKTKALVAVNLYGLPIDAVRLRAFCDEHHLVLIEDNAQGLGGFANVSEQSVSMGLLGDISTTSFFPTKPLGCAGDGGAIVTTNLIWAERVRCLARHGQAEKYDYRMVGRNSRLDAIQAEILRVKLKHLPEFVQVQQRTAQTYTEALRDNARLTLPMCESGASPTYHQYTLLLDEGLDRERIRLGLIDRGIASGLYYPKPLHCYEVYAERSLVRSSLSRSEDLSRRMLSLPIFPLMTEQEISYVIDNLKDLLR